MTEVYQHTQDVRECDPVENSIEMARFNQGLRQALSVSKEDLKRLLAREKTRNAVKPKRGPKAKATAVNTLTHSN